MTKITLWIPAVERPSWRANLSWWNMDTPDNQKLPLVRSGANNVKYSWNEVIVNFLKTDHEWILSVHNDVEVSKETLTRLLSWNRPLVSALIFMRQSPVMPHIWKGYPGYENFYSQRVNDTRLWFRSHPEYFQEFGPFVMNPRPTDSLVSVDFTSTSCMLIHRAVLEDMREIVKNIWFKWDDDYNGGGEDRRFCQYARKMGYQTYVDRSCIVGHLAGDIPTSAADFFAWDYVSTVNGVDEPHELIR